VTESACWWVSFRVCVVWGSWIWVLDFAMAEWDSEEDGLRKSSLLGGGVEFVLGFWGSAMFPRASEFLAQ
jgi:hypothetical protein